MQSGPSDDGLQVSVKNLQASKKVHFSVILIQTFGNVYFHFQGILHRMSLGQIVYGKIELLHKFASFRL